MRKNLPMNKPPTPKPTTGGTTHRLNQTPKPHPKMPTGSSKGTSGKK